VDLLLSGVGLTGRAEVGAVALDNTYQACTNSTPNLMLVR